jgi:hypothetical protein
MELYKDFKLPLIAMLALLMAVPTFAHDKKKKDRAMIEKMEAVPCGAKERGLTGLGSVFASVGVTSVNSDEKLCPQYLLRTDEMEYHVRPLDHKHPVLLPIGKEAEYKLAKDKFDLSIPDGDHKVRHYQVVSMKPIDHSATPAPESTKYDLPRNDSANRPIPDGNYANKNTAPPPVKPNEE